METRHQILGESCGINRSFDIYIYSQGLHDVDDFSREKYKGRPNEDQYCLEYRDGTLLAGVFDGGTDLVGYKNKEGQNGAYLAATIAKRFFEKDYWDYEELWHLDFAARKANEALRDAMLDAGISLRRRRNLWNTTLSIVRINNGHMSYVQLGDSPIIIFYRDKTYKVIDEEKDHNSKSLRMWTRLLSQGVENPAQDSQMQEQLLETRARAGKDYGALNGDPQSMEFVKLGIEPLEKIDRIILLTDGWILRPKYFEAREQLYMPIISACSDPKKGLLWLLRDIRRKENLDPQCSEYPRFKKHDDMTAIEISL